MNNISFKANLIIDKSLYKNMPVDTPEGYTDDLVREYKKFTDHKVIKKITEGDTIELYKAPHKSGFALGIKYTNSSNNETIESGIYTNKKVPTVKVGSLIHDTMTYIIVKSGIKPKSYETIQKSFARAVEKLLKQT